MNNQMRVLSKLGDGKSQDLVFEVPLEFAHGLNIRSDGSIDTKTLLDLFSTMLCNEESCQLPSDDLTLIQEKIELMLNIYDSDRAID
jgi:hypothetical protein